MRIHGVCVKKRIKVEKRVFRAEVGEGGGLLETVWVTSGRDEVERGTGTFHGGHRQGECGYGA